MQLVLIRHGKTKGNLEKRYIGSTDEPLCEWGIEQLRESSKSEWMQLCRKTPFQLYASPMKRCIQTCHLLFADHKINIEEQFKEMDFGLFENKNYKELSGDYEYQKWIDSNGTIAFPQGESREVFIARCCEGIKQILLENKDSEENVIVVAHGGTIMAILDQYEQSERTYYDYQCDNGCGYICEVEWNECDAERVFKLRTIEKIE